jgi:hypothetical protein
MAKNGKAKTKTTGKTKERKQKAPKKTAEQMSDEQRRVLLFNHKRKLKPLLAAEKEAKAAVTKAFDVAKAEGIPKKDLKLAILLESDEGIEATKLDVERTQRIARWMGVGRQLDLFAATTKPTNAERHYEDGKLAALNDQPAKPPSHLSQKDHQHWLEGHAAGRTALNTERASGGFRPLSDVVDDLAEKAGIAGSLGTEAPTHQVHQ